MCKQTDGVKVRETVSKQSNRITHTVIVPQIRMRLLRDCVSVLDPSKHLHKAAADGLAAGRPDRYASTIRGLDHDMVLLHCFEMAG